MNKKIKFIKVLSGCGASGESLQAQKTYAVPDEVSEKDARLLIQLRKAEPADEPADVKAEAKNAKSKKSENTDLTAE